MTRWPRFERTSRHTIRAAAVVAALSAAVLAAGAAVAASSGTASPAAGSSGVTAVASCTALDLPTLGGLYGNVTAAVTDGDVVGLADDTSGAPQPVLWRTGKPERIRTGLSGSVPSGLNNRGDVVGNSPNGENTVGWVWSGNRTIRLKGAGELTALPAAISDHGVIVGALESSEGLPGEGDNQPGTSENEQGAVWLTPTSSPQLLAPLPGDQGAHAFAVDGFGRIGGVSEGDSFRPVLWDLAGKVHELPGLGGEYGAVRAFGPGGIAVGDAVAKDGSDHAVMWDASGRITDLGLPAGSRTAQANGVLPGGVVVGTAEMPAPGGGVLSQAVRWPAPGNPQLMVAPQALQQNVVAAAAWAQTAAGYRADAKGGRHPVMWRCGQ
jgi:YD repeat-containing protein